MVPENCIHVRYAAPYDHVLILGSIFNTVAAIVTTLLFVFPVIVELGYDPILWGVVNVIATQIGS